MANNQDKAPTLQQVFALAKAERIDKQELSKRIEHYLTWTINDLNKLLKADTLTALDHILIKIIVNAADTGSMERLDNLVQKVTMDAPVNTQAPQLNFHVDAELIARAVKKNYQRMVEAEGLIVEHQPTIVDDQPTGEVH